MTATLYANRDKREAVEALEAVRREATAHGIEIADDGEIVIALGGDGTILRAVREFKDAVVLGLNFGNLGYLSSVAAGEFKRALADLAAGRYRVSERRLVAVNGRTALNDVVVSRDGGCRSALFDLEADGKLVTRYMADGLVFSTPTGSTAYSLAAGGPVVMPDVASLVVTPLSPHALGVRPLVTRDDVRFRVTVRARTKDDDLTVGVYADGEKVCSLKNGESVEIAAADVCAKLVELEGYNPYEVLARKLGWSGSSCK